MENKNTFLTVSLRKLDKICGEHYKEITRQGTDTETIRRSALQLLPKIIFASDSEEMLDIDPAGYGIYD